MSVSREEAITFLEIACRNWSFLPRLSEDDLGDVATALVRFVGKKTEAPEANLLDQPARVGSVVFRSGTSAFTVIAAAQRLYDHVDAAKTKAPAPQAPWNDPVTAPKDGTMLHLLVQPGHEELDAFTSFLDSRESYETIGFNQFADTLEDVWQFAGWDWCHDCITDGHGEVIGWLPFGVGNNPAPAPRAEGHE